MAKLVREFAVQEGRPAFQSLAQVYNEKLAWLSVPIIPPSGDKEISEACWSTSLADLGSFLSQAIRWSTTQKDGPLWPACAHTWTNTISHSCAFTTQTQ